MGVCVYVRFKICSSPCDLLSARWRLFVCLYVRVCVWDMCLITMHVYMFICTLEYVYVCDCVCYLYLFARLCRVCVCLCLHV